MRGSSVSLNSPPLPSLLRHQRGLAGLGVDAHRAELEHRELFAAAADALLPEDDRAAVLQLDRGGDEQQHGEMTIRPTAGEDDVAAALHHPAPAGEVRLLDVQERNTHQRPDVHAGTGDLDQARVDQHLDAGALQRPGEPPQVVVAGGVVAGDCDGVAVHALTTSATSRRSPRTGIPRSTTSPSSGAEGTHRRPSCRNVSRDPGAHAARGRRPPNPPRQRGAR